MADGVCLENDREEIKFLRKALSEIELGEILDNISTRIVRTREEVETVEKKALARALPSGVRVKLFSVKQE